MQQDSTTPTPPRTREEMAGYPLTTGAAAEPIKVYLTVEACEDHGGHAEAFYSLEGARDWVALRRDEWLAGIEDSADDASEDTPDAFSLYENSIHIELDYDGGNPHAVAIHP